MTNWSGWAGGGGGGHVLGHFQTASALTTKTVAVNNDVANDAESCTIGVG